MSAGGDAKFFQRGKIQELRAELTGDKRDSKHAKKRVALKKVVANMTMGNDMSPLFSDVIACMQIPLLEIKKMVYLYLIHYSKSKPDLAALAINSFVRDSIDSNPLIRALAVRTMSYIQVDKVVESLTDPLRNALRDTDPYVRKTAAIAVAKLFMHNPMIVEREGFLDLLLDLLNDSNATVLSNAVAALTEISDRSEGFEFTLDISTANKLLTAINDCSEWGQVYILEGLLFYVPQESEDAELLADRVLARLQHANSAVVLSAVRVILYLLNYMSEDETVEGFYRKIGPPLVTLLHNGPEVQYVTLRNILLIIQKRPDFLKNEMKVFFCKYNDPIYVKLAKLEIIVRLANENNVTQVLSELREYASEVDVEFVRKSVRAIGRCAIKIEKSADKCIQTLLDLIHTKVNYVVQEAIVVIKDIFRKYPNRYESIISTLCENLDSLDEPEAKASMIWIIGHYADRIENANDLLAAFLETFKEDPAEVQLALLTAVVKLFIRRPTLGQELVPKMLTWATEDLDNPDVRDRAFIYWRLLSTNPVAAKSVVFADMPTISTETDNLEPSFLDDLLLYVSSLGSVYHKLPTTFIGGIKARKLAPSKALNLMYRAAAPLQFDGPVVGASAPSASNVYGDSGLSNPYGADTVRPYGLDAMEAAMEADLEDMGDQDIGGQDGSAGGYLSTMLSNMDLGTASSPTSPVGPGPNARDYDYLRQSTHMGSSHLNGSTTDLASSGLGSRHSSTDSLPGQHAAASAATHIHPAYNDLDALAGLGTSAPSAGPSAPQSQAVPVRQTSMQNAPLSPPQQSQPFAGAPPAGTLQRDTYGSAAVPSTGGFVPPKVMLLNPQNARGLEITGTFARRLGQMYMDLDFTNRSGDMLSDFAIQFNKNSFGICPGGTLDVQSPLPPGSTSRTSLRLRADGPSAPMNPVNLVQIAIKCNTGISYFAVQLPLHILFAEGGIDQGTWLRMWREDIPASNEWRSPLAGLRFATVADLRSKLALNNIYTVADRLIEGKHHVYSGTRLMDGTVLLTEITLDTSISNGLLAVKSMSSPQVVEVFMKAVTAVLLS